MMELGPTAVWCRVVIRWPGTARRVSGAIGGPGPPDLGAVERLARWALAAQRSGGALVVRAACGEMRELLELAGLGGQVGGQGEDGEDPIGVEERVDGGDAAP